MADKTRFVYHGHSNVEIHHGKHVVQLDPFYTSNKLADIKADKAKPHFILLSHAHFDHTEDVEAIAKRTNAMVICNYEMSVYFEKKGVQRTHGMNHGGGYEFPFGHVTLTLAFHTSSFPDGAYGGQPAGLIIELQNGPTVYFAGDTALFGDMKIIGKLWDIDLAFLPIGDNYTMGPDHAIIAAKWLQCSAVVPVHYNTFPEITQDAEVFAKRLKKKTGIRGLPLKPGESVEF